MTTEPERLSVDGQRSVDRQLSVDSQVLASQPQQLVVELGDHRLVAAALQARRLTPTNVRTNDDLGLALLDLPDLKGYHPDPRPTGADGRAAAARCPFPAVGRTGLDLLLADLRWGFCTVYDGWVPTMGKNRLLTGAHALPYIKGLAVPGPKAAAPVDIPPGPPTGPRVGIADTRLYPHPALAGRYLADPYPPGEQPATANAAHATFVAGVVLQRAPRAELVVRQVLDDGAGSRFAWDVAVGLVEFLRLDVAVLNLSFGCATADGRPPLVLRRAVERLSPSIVLVAAAGNHGIADDLPPGMTTHSPFWPAALDGVVAVGADNSTGQAPFCPDLPWVDLTAPGAGVTSTFLPGPVLVAAEETADFGSGYAEWNGTSFAAAAVTGAIAARAGAGRTAYEALAELGDASADGIAAHVPTPARAPA